MAEVLLDTDEIAPEDKYCGHRQQEPVCHAALHTVSADRVVVPGVVTGTVTLPKSLRGVEKLLVNLAV